MSAVDDQTTYGRARLSFASQADIDEFVTVLDKYERGEITPDQWRAFRLVRGTYGQRQAEDAQMLRIKIPQGLLTAPQLQALADVGEQYSRGFGHITTRQNVQFHFVKLHDVGAGDAQPGRIGPDDARGVRELGPEHHRLPVCRRLGRRALRRHALRGGADAVSAAAPAQRRCCRASSRSPSRVAPSITSPPGSTTWRSRRWSDATAGAGSASRPAAGPRSCVTEGTVIHQFLPTSEIFRVAEAVLRVFHRYGDYQHKQRNRMKFMIKTMGWTRWREEYDRELSGIRLRGEVPTLDIETPELESMPTDPRAESPSLLDISARVASGKIKGPGIMPVVVPVLNSRDEDYTRWRASNVRAQKQFGYAMVVATIPLGDMTSAQMRVLADLAQAYGDGTVRVSMEQDLVFRWVKSSDVRQLYSRLSAAGLGLAEAGTIADVASCPGAESCRLAVTQSRGLGRLLEDHLRSRRDLIAAADGARIKISGCPNGCGQHHIATLGFQGSVRRLGSRAVPQYFVMVGGGTEHGGATFARLAAKIPARRIRGCRGPAHRDVCAREERAESRRRASSGASASRRSV